MLFSDSLGVSGDTSRVLLSIESSRSSRSGGGGRACSGYSLWSESAAVLTCPVTRGTGVRPVEKEKKRAVKYLHRTIYIGLHFKESIPRSI